MINDALKFVQTFDGSGNVEDFLNGVQNGENVLAEPDRPSYLLMLKSKLRGEPLRTTENVNFENIEAFKDHFRKLYGPNETYTQLQLKLATIYQFLDESIIRLSDLSKQIKLATSKMDCMITYHIAKYCPLHTKIQQSDTKDNTPISEALIHAIVNEKLKEINNSQPRQDRVKCTYCGKLYHKEKNCFQKNKNPNNPGNSNKNSFYNTNPSNQTFQSNTNQSPPISCYYCNIRGHNERNCRKKKAAELNKAGNANNTPPNSYVNNRQYYSNIYDNNYNRSQFNQNKNYNKGNRTNESNESQNDTIY